MSGVKFWHLVMWWLTTLTFLGGHTAGVESAGPGTDGEVFGAGNSVVPAGQGLVITFSRTDPGRVQKILLDQQHAQPPLIEPAVQIRADTPWLVDAIRRHLLIGRLEARETMACGPEVPHLETLVTSAEQFLKAGKLKKMAQLVEDARQVFRCETANVPRETLIRLLWLEAEKQSFRKQDPTEIIERIRSLEPGATPPAGSSAALQKSVSPEKLKSDPEKVLLRWRPVDELALWLDGVPTEAPELHVAEGVHFVQWVSPDGQALAGYTVALVAEGAGGPSELPPFLIHPQSRAEVLAAMEKMAESGPLDRALTQALIEVLKEWGYPWLLLIGEATSIRAPGIVRLRADGSALHTIVPLELE